MTPMCVRWLEYGLQKMLPDDPLEISEIIREVTAAFDGVRLGNGTSLHRARHIDDFWEDDPSLKANDPEISWSELTDQKMREFNDVFNFLDAEGIRFYLPAFIGWVLRDAADGLEDSLHYAIFGLMDPDGSLTPSDRFIGWTSLLTPAQKRAVGRFVRYKMRDEWWSLEAHAAWDYFWASECLKF